MIDLEDMRRALLALRVDCDDADAVTADMLRPPRKRELGPVLARQNYNEARAKIVNGIAYLFSLAAEPSDPAGNSGSPAH